MSEPKYYSVSPDEAAGLLKSDPKHGLTAVEAAKRLAEHGPNQLKGKKGISPLTIFIEQFQDFIVWVLIGAALVSGFLQEWVDASAIIAIVILNSILGFIQEYRAEKSLAALKKLSSPASKVIRGGRLEIVPSAQIVPGDLIELEAGDNIPADARVVYATPNFNTSEASLTGESGPVAKTTLALEEKEIPLAERANMVYMGTFVAAGKARAIVVETGMNTELGKIAGMIQEVGGEETPLQKKLEQFGKWIVYACIILVVLVFLLEMWRGGELLTVFITAVSLAVAAIPEGLPVVVTIALALGVQRMVKRHALIRKLPSVETLGSATVICSDKTGTLTKNEMTVQVVYAGGNLFSVTGIGYEPKGEFQSGGRRVDITGFPSLKKALVAGVLCNGAQLIDSKILGDPTEGAILTAAAKADLWKEKLEAEHPFVEEIPFDSERKKMTIVRKENDKYVAYVKGAPDILLNDCVDDQKEEVLKVNAYLTSQAMRVLAVAYKVLDNAPSKYDAETIENNLTFLGLIGMIDPPREEVKEAIKKCNTAGIRTVMITGDHKNTAIAIARQLGFLKEALSGEELDQLSDSELYNRIENVSVYARVSPEHKLRIVRTLRKHGEIVAMTGDGVNDAPAIKEADIGIAMGITGTDVTKEVSDMVITDDNFASIVAAVEEGRGIYDNIKKFVHYLLSCNAGEILVMFTASLLGMPVPLLPIQILWINLVTDGFPALALGVDPVNPNIMNQPPRPTHEPVVTRSGALLMLTQGVFMAICALFAFAFMFYLAGESLAHARTAAFVVLACSQLFHSFNCRSQKASVFKLGLFSNPSLIYAFLFSFALLMMVVYLPLFQQIFKTEAILGAHWIYVIIISSLPLWGMEIIKRINKKGGFIK